MKAQVVPEFVARTEQAVTLSIVSLTGSQWSGSVREVSVPGRSGRFGIMSGHTPVLGILREGCVRIFPATGENAIELYVSGGFVEIQPDQVMILADLALRSDDQDSARAEAARLAASSPMAASFTDETYAAMHADLMHHFGANVRTFRR